MHLTQNSQVVSVDGNVLTLGFNNAGRAGLLPQRGLRRGAASGRHRRGRRRLDGSRRWSTPARSPARPRRRRPAGARGASARASSVSAVEQPAAARRARPPDWAADEPARQTDPVAVTAAREAIKQTRQSGAAPTGSPGLADTGEDVSHPDDPDADTDGLDATELLRA